MNVHPLSSNWAAANAASAPDAGFSPARLTVRRQWCRHEAPILLTHWVIVVEICRYIETHQHLFIFPRNMTHAKIIVILPTSKVHCTCHIANKYICNTTLSLSLYINIYIYICNII